MIEFIRKQLELTREDFSSYLGLSSEMIKSVEMGRRQLPKNSLDAVAALVLAIKEGQALGLVGDPGAATSEQIKSTKRLQRKYSRRLTRYNGKLEEMKKSYASACVNVGIYQRFVQSLTPARTEDQRARLKWAQWKVAETIKHLQEVNVTAQNHLAAEIAGLKSMLKILEG